MSYWGKVAGTAVAVNVVAAATPALLRAAGLFGRPDEGVETGLGLVFLLGVVNLFWIGPLFAVAASVGRAAARRRRPTGLVMAAVLLAGLPFALVGPLLLADWPEFVLYGTVVYAAGLHRLRRLAVAEGAA